MGRWKVYLSKSKAGSFNDLMKIKEELKEYDIEVLEFQGGSYNTNLLDSSDYLLVIPPSDKNFNIGRGQTEEIVRADEKGLTILVAAEINPIKIVEISEHDLAIIKKDWQTNWATIDIDSDYESDNLYDWFEYAEECITIDYRDTLERYKLKTKEGLDKIVNSITIDPFTGKPFNNSVKKDKIKPMLATVTLFNLQV